MIRNYKKKNWPSSQSKKLEKTSPVGKERIIAIMMKEGENIYTKKQLDRLATKMGFGFQGLGVAAFLWCLV